jgi:hypothetical protein
MTDVQTTLAERVFSFLTEEQEGNQFALEISRTEPSDGSSGLTLTGSSPHAQTSQLSWTACSSQLPTRESSPTGAATGRRCWRCKKRWRI